MDVQKGDSLMYTAHFILVIFQNTLKIHFFIYWKIVYCKLKNIHQKLVPIGEPKKQGHLYKYNISSDWRWRTLSLKGMRFTVDQFSRSVMSDSLRPHALQHARLPCPSPTPRAYSNSCPSRRWCHPTISSSVIPFSSRIQSFPASGTFPMSQFFTSGVQSIGK